LISAREGSRALQALTGEQRAIIINRLADSLIERQKDILDANQMDVEKAYTDGTRINRNLLIMLLTSIFYFKVCKFVFFF